MHLNMVQAGYCVLVVWQPFLQPPLCYYSVPARGLLIIPMILPVQLGILPTALAMTIVIVIGEFADHVATLLLAMLEHFVVRPG